MNIGGRADMGLSIKLSPEVIKARWIRLKEAANYAATKAWVRR
jgi:hypothetical protein